MKSSRIFVLILFIIQTIQGLCSELEALQEEYKDWRLQRSPEYATSIGVYKYNDRVEDFDYSVFEKEYNKCLSLLNRLKEKVIYDRLDVREKLDYDVFNDTLSTIVQGYNWKDYNALNPVDFLEGPHIEPSYLPSITPFDTVGDYENYVRRLERLPNQVASMVRRFQKAVEKGHTFHNVSVSKVPGQIDTLLNKYNATTYPYYKPLLGQLSKLQNIKDSKKVELRGRAKVSVENILTKFSELKLYLENNYSYHLREGFGVSSWNNGEAFYRACLKWHLSLDISPEDVHRKGLEEVERISLKMKEVMAKLNHHGSVKEFFDNLRKNPAFLLQTGDEMIEWFTNAIKKDVEPKMKSYFKDLPNLPVVVEPNPIDGIFGQYRPGSVDGSRPGVFQINTHRPNKSLTLPFMALLLHEAIPGHHLQGSYQLTAKIPAYRTYSTDDNKYFQPPMLAPFYTAFMEGWALYSEYLGEEMQLYKTDYDLMGRYASEIFRACRLVVDTGLHQFNWTREKAIEYMLNYTAKNEKAIAIEIDRYITWPGQACAYKIGELKIKELRKKAENELGSRFDIRDFHATVLKYGVLPLNILESNVNQWIIETKKNPTDTFTKCTSSGSRENNTLTILTAIIFMHAYWQLM